MLLQGRTAIVTGAGNLDGIGFAVARLFVAEGARVILADRDAAGVAEAAGVLGPMALGSATDGFVCAEAAGG